MYTRLYNSEGENNAFVNSRVYFMLAYELSHYWD